MAWRDRYRRGSFRGVSFFILRHDSLLAGRRIVTHSYPGRDLPSTEDLGRVVREFTFSAYVLGENYDFDRDRLIAACAASGPGQLVHPYRGIETVVCRECRVIEATDEGRMARFTLTFGEDGGEVAPQITIDHSSRVGTAVAAAQSAMISHFNNRFRVN